MLESKASNIPEIRAPHIHNGEYFFVVNELQRIVNCAWILGKIESAWMCK